MKLSLISEGKERAQSIRDDILSGKLAFRYIAKKHGVSLPYISAIASRLGKGRGRPPGVVPGNRTSGLRPSPVISPMPIMGTIRR